MAATGPNYAYFQGRIVPIEQATVSVMTHALNYGTGVFGGMRAYWNAEEEQLFLFRPLDHFKRLIQSAQLMRIDVGHTPEELVAIVSELLRKEGYRTNTYIRPLVYKAQPTIKVQVHDIEDALTIFAMPFGAYLKEGGVHAHLRVAARGR